VKAIVSAAFEKAEGEEGRWAALVALGDHVADQLQLAKAQAVHQGARITRRANAKEDSGGIKRTRERPTGVQRSNEGSRGLSREEWNEYESRNRREGDVSVTGSKRHSTEKDSREFSEASNVVVEIPMMTMSKSAVARVKHRQAGLDDHETVSGNGAFELK
jgi:hypothetical protein